MHLRAIVAVKQNARKIFIFLFLLIFFIVYYSILYFFYLLPNGSNFSIFTFVGFTLIILVVFYFLFNVSKHESNRTILTFKTLNENWIKILLIGLMSVTIWIPPVSFSELIIRWKAISILNYFRAIVFLIGIVYVPGSSIFNIFFPNSKIHERFKVESVYLKITLYPFLSITFLGVSTVILDVLKINQHSFSFVLFGIIIILFSIDIVIQMFFRKANFKTLFTEIKLSKFTSLILLVGLGIIMIACGNQFIAKYCVSWDHYAGISYASYVGNPNVSKYKKFISYAPYWGYISFGLSSLCGIPYINTNAMLFPFLYLFVNSIYLLIKALLHNMKEKFSVLSSFFVVTFSGLFYFVGTFTGISWFIFDGIMFFRYKSFAIFLFIISTALFINATSFIERPGTKRIEKLEAILTLFLSAFLLFQSYMIYFLPAIPGMTLTLFYSFFSENRKKNIFRFLIFFSFFVFFFILFDFILDFFYTYWNMAFFSYFFEIGKTELSTKFLFPNALKIYFALIITCLFSFYLYVFLIIIEKKGVNKGKKKLVFIIFALIFNGFLFLCYLLLTYYFKFTPVYFFLYFFSKSKPNLENKIIFYNTLLFCFISVISSVLFFIIYMINNRSSLQNKESAISHRYKLLITKFCFIISAIIFSIFFIIFIVWAFILGINTFLTLYLTMIFFKIGLIGISGVYLSYFSRKENKNVFYVLLIWGFFMFVLASILVFRYWYLYYSISPNKIPVDYYEKMELWFSRVWHYSIIPLSIFSAIGLIKLMEYFKSLNIWNKSAKRDLKNVKTGTKLVITSFFIVFILSTTIISTSYYQNKIRHLEDDEANTLGWISENIPFNENIIHDNDGLACTLYEFRYYNIYHIWTESVNTLEGLSCPIISYDSDSDCYLNYVEYIDGYYDILSIEDKNANGNVVFRNKFVNSQNFGWIEFLIRTTDKNKLFTIDLNRDEDLNTAIKIMIMQNGIYCYNSNIIENIVNINNNEWYKLKIFFDCTNNSYNGLAKFQWNLEVNEIKYGDFKFLSNYTALQWFSAYSDDLSNGNTVYINDLNYLWEQKEDVIYYAHKMMVNNLRARNIKYFIISRDITFYQSLGESINSELNYYYLNMDDYLLANLYTEKIYACGDLKIYKY